MRQLADLMGLLFLAELRTWLRTPKHILLSLTFGVMFLVVGTRMLTITFGPHVCLGVVTTSTNMARRVARQFERVNAGVVRYDTLAHARRDLASDRIVGIITISNDAIQSVHMTFSGRDPMLDREVAVLLMRTAARVTDGPVAGRLLTQDHNSYTPERMTLHVVASLLPFLILAVASVNCGLLWLSAMESGTVQRYLLAAAPPAVWVGCRVAANVLFTFLMVLLAVALSRPFVAWATPSAWLAWLGVLALQSFAAAGLFFLLAALCRRHMLYADLSVLINFLLMFMSGALTPVLVMTRYDQVLAACTPTYYFIRATRAVMTGGAPLLASDLVVIALWGLACFGAGYWRIITTQLDRNR